MLAADARIRATADTPAILAERGATVRLVLDARTGDEADRVDVVDIATDCVRARIAAAVRTRQAVG